MTKQFRSVRLDIGCRFVIMRRRMLLALATVLTMSLPPAAQSQYAPQIKVIGTGAVGAPQQGRSVALSSDGRTFIVGGPFARLSTPSGFVGAAWVFTRSGRSWAQEAVLIGADILANTLQGYSVALSDDGNTALVGGPGDVFTPGHAWVYSRSGAGRWTQQAILVGGGAAGFPQQGHSVALSGDGSTALVGGPGDNSAGGAAWVFTRSGRVWSQQGLKLVGSGSIGSAWQGWSASLSRDGNVALIGGPGDDNGVGAAWSFRRRSDGTWSQSGGKLVGAGSVGAAGQGWSVSLSSNGDIAIIGGPWDNSNVGASWLFDRQSGNAWSQRGPKLVGAGAVGAARQGASVSIAGNGSTALAGGPGDNNFVGAAWSFTRWGGVWRQQGLKLVGARAMGPAEQGSSVSLSGSGNIAIVGGPNDNDSVGAAWIYTRTFAGQPGQLDCNHRSIMALITQFGGMNTAAWSLGYGSANVESLRSSMHAYCGDRD